MPVIPIGDHEDPRLADYRNIPDPELIARHGIFVAEGRLVVRRLLTSGRLAARSVLVTSAALASLRDLLPDVTPLHVYEAPQQVLDAIAGFHIHRGCLAIGERPHPVPAADLVTGARRVVVLEQVGNPDNVGAVFRHAAAFGADAVLLDRRCADPLYRKAIRTSMATSLAVPFAEVTPWPAGLRLLQDRGFALVALANVSDALPLHTVAARVGGRPVAVVAGHEGDGITPPVLAGADYRARIPIAAAVDSLNVAAAVAIALYEFTRASEAMISSINPATGGGASS